MKLKRVMIFLCFQLYIIHKFKNGKQYFRTTWVTKVYKSTFMWSSNFTNSKLQFIISLVKIEEETISLENWFFLASFFQFSQSTNLLFYLFNQLFPPQLCPCCFLHIVLLQNRTSIFSLKKNENQIY